MKRPTTVGDLLSFCSSFTFRTTGQPHRRCSLPQSSTIPLPTEHTDSGDVTSPPRPSMSLVAAFSRLHRYSTSHAGTEERSLHDVPPHVPHSRRSTQRTRPNPSVGARSYPLNPACSFINTSSHAFCGEKSGRARLLLSADGGRFALLLQPDHGGKGGAAVEQLLGRGVGLRRWVSGLFFVGLAWCSRPRCSGGFRVSERTWSRKSRKVQPDDCCWPCLCIVSREGSCGSSSMRATPPVRRTR